MAKAPAIKFPRIQAGFYAVTQDGELRGYIMKEETDDKVTNWYVFDNNTPDLDVAMLHPENAIGAPDELFREAKETAKGYFLSTPMAAEVNVVEPEVVNLPESEWVDEDEMGGDWEENTIMMETDENGIEFELLSDEGELTEEEIDEALALV